MKCIFFFSMLIGAIFLNAQDMPVRLPSIISDHAVLQQSTNARLWGWGPSTRTIAIVGSWAPNDTVRASVTDECTWEASIKTPTAGGPYTIQFINSSSIVTIKDILIGEVWLCSGQSNMAMPCNAEIADRGNILQAPPNKRMRFFVPELAYDVYPRSDCKGKWVICDASTLAYFSAVGFFFAHKLQERLQVPAGMIGVYLGATRIQPWMPRQAIEEDTELSKVSRNIGTAWAPQGVSLLYNGMIRPLAPYSLSGVIWYQGETNACSDAESRCYGQMLRRLITSWRTAFRNDFPFYFVQIAPFDGYYPRDAAAYLREQQETALVLPKTGMINIGDKVDAVKDIHPKLKAVVGERLANLALKETYHYNDLNPYFPHFAKMDVRGGTVIATVAAAGQLQCRGNEILNFQLAGEDHVFYPAKAVVEQDGTIALKSKGVKAPVAVRYCFSNEAMPDLFDMNDLPLLPFRTDKW
ncbi:MAG: sialate O-acetylesterase [Niabella sp.]|nr:sialate O-acetylesterase [Niabella sp.]